MPVDHDTDVIAKSRTLIVVVCAILSFTATAAENSRKVHFREQHNTSYILTDASNRDWTVARRGNNSAGTVELGSRIVLQIEPQVDLNVLIANRGLTLSRTLSSGLFILQAQDSRSAIDAAEALAGEPGVITSYPVMRRAYRHQNAYAAAPNDSYFDQQWQLENRGPDGNLAGPDLNVRAAWPVTKGAESLVAVADDGFQLNHPDLTNRASGGPHFNFFQGTTNGNPYGAIADHATAVAGLIGAESENQRGVAGVAPQAKLASWVIFGASSFGSEVIASDEQLMDMFQYASNRVAVQNHSWAGIFFDQAPLDPLSNVGISNAVFHGRGGKGVVIVRAAGNDRADLLNANDEGYSNDPRVITVAAVRKDGRACSYSNRGACVLVGSPSGDINDGIDPGTPDVLTTDRTGPEGYNTGAGDQADYSGFNGTSASSPEVAGVCALIVSANTNLTYRDVQQILAQSARHFDFADPDLRTNGAGLRFSHNVGFGIPDAGFAVQLAKSWSNRPPLKEVKIETNLTQFIPDDALRVLCTGPGLASSLTNIRSFPSLGLHPDNPTPALPLVDVGEANEELTVDLHGRAALIQRGTSFFRDKIARAARAGAGFAVIFNNTGTTAIQPLGGTDYAPIMAVAIGKIYGDGLRAFLASNPNLTARLQLTPTIYQFNVTNTLICEQVGLRLKTTHTSRSDVRVTLVSPMGTRSILQALNADTSSGPVDWTYWTVQHFCESSAGQWRLEVSDEQNADVGYVTYAQLIVQGVEITDVDRDGMSDPWEQLRFGNLNHLPEMIWMATDSTTRANK
jgi:hypothetical protein